MNRHFFTTKNLKRTIRFFLWIIAGFFTLLLGLSLLLLIPGIQQFTVNKAASFISAKTNMHTVVGAVYIGFPKTINIGKVYLEDIDRDTLLFCNEISINADLIPLLRNKLNIDELSIQGLHGNIKKSRKDSVYNFSPIVDVFSKKESQKEDQGKSKWNIGFDDISLKEIRINYEDLTDSSSINLSLGHLELTANKADLINQIFDLKNVKVAQTSLSMVIGNKKKGPSNPKDLSPKKSNPISLQLDELAAEDIQFSLDYLDERLGLKATLQEAILHPELLDLTNQKITMRDIQADGIDVAFRLMNLQSQDSSKIQSETLVDELNQMDYTFGNFGWDFIVDHAEISNTSYKMDLNNSPHHQRGIDYMHMEFKGFNITSDSIFFNKNNSGANVSSMKVTETSGPEIHDLTGRFFVDNQQIIARDFELRTQGSQMSGSVVLAYPELRLIGKKVDQLGINSSMKGNIKLSELRPFTSTLDSIPFLSNLSMINIGEFKTSGKLGNLNLENAKLSTAGSTNMIATAKITGLPSTNIELSCKLDTFFTTKDDIYKIFPADLIPIDIELPNLVSAKLTGKTNLKSGELNGNINTDLGNAIIIASLSDGNIASTIALEEIDIGSITKNSALGSMSSTSHVEAQLQEFSLNNLYSKTDLHSFHFNGYTYRNATLDLSWKDEGIVSEMQVNDSSLVAHVIGEYNSLDTGKHMVLSLDVEKSNLQTMNFTNDYFAVIGKANINMNVISSDIFNGMITAAQITLEKENSSFQIDTLSFKSDINENYTNFDLQSEIFEAKLTGNTKLSELKDAIIDQLDLYISLPDSIVNDKDFDFKFHLDLKNPDIFTAFLIEGLEDLKFEKCFMEYNDRRDYLVAEIAFPRIKYNSFIFEDLSLSIDSKGESAISKLNLASFIYDTLRINNIAFRSEFEYNKAKSFIRIHDLNEKLKYQLISTLSYQDSIYEIQIDPKQTIIKYDPWILPEDNYLRMVNGNLHSHAAEIRHDEQVFSLEAEGSQMDFNFKNINLDNFNYLLEDDSLYNIFHGVINGSVAFTDVLDHPKIHGKLEIPELVVFNEILGSIDINFSKDSNAEFGIKLQNEENLILAKGMISDNSMSNSSSIFIESDIRNAKSFLPFFHAYLSELDGGIEGRLTLVQNGENISLNGNLNFNELQTTISASNTLLKQNGQITIEDNIVHFNSYNIKDSLENVLAIKGDIDFSDYYDPNYHLNINAKDFLAINSLPGQEQIIVGKLNVGLDIDIVGPQTNLNVQSQFSINENTNLTYIMPGEELELITDEGIVKFMDFENQAYEQLGLTQSEFIGDSLISQIKGVDFSAILNVNPKAKFKVIVDPNSGDFTEFQISGKLAYKYNDKLRGHLTGLIELENGQYDLSFYGLVKKRFVYDPGSTISWSGEVMEGEINFSARHTVRTNSVGLVSNEISSYERAIYNQRLPYDVILQINEKISSPGISFKIDLPERHRSTYPTLDSKLNILNQPNMESERNKQVFALLVGGTFIPENPDINEGSSNSNFATTAARNSVNAIMTQQLNNLTGQFIQGFDVDLGLNSYDDYAGDKAQTKTQLDVKVSKNLFNDRVSAEMESHIDLEGSNKQVAGQSTAGMTEYAVSYKLTETGNYRIKAFRENAFDIFDGEIQNSGLAFIFMREFDSFKRKNPDKIHKNVNETEGVDK